MGIRVLQFVILLWVGVSSDAHGLWSRCEMEVFTPRAIQNEVLSILPELGIAALPANRQLLFPMVDVLPGRQALLRNELLIGQIQFLNDVRLGVSAFAILDGRNRPLIRVSESHFACPEGDAGGPCHQVAILTEYEPEIDRVPAYSIWAEGPLTGARARYFRYGREVGRYDFTNGVKEALHWLSGTLYQAQSVTPLKALALLDRARPLLASDPYVVRYIGSVRLYEWRGQLVISGVVPSNFVYGRVIDRVRDAGYRNLRVDLVIDTRTQIPLQPLVLGLAGCQ